MKLYELVEGRNDPHTHKAIFMLGGPGSGKTHVAKKLAGGTGLRSVNVDEFYELLRDRQGIQGRGFDDDLYKYSGSLTQKKLDLLLGGRIGLIIDGTGRKIERLTEIKNDLEKMGYDTMAVFVNTELNKALDRNEERRRKADSEWVRKVHAELKSKLGSLQSIFHNMLIVDNSEDGNDFVDAQKQVDKFLNAPHARPVDWPVSEEVNTQDSLPGDVDSWKEIVDGLHGGDDAEYYKRVAMKVLRDAKDFIGESGQPLKLAYRGYERAENYPFHRAYRDNRAPKDSSKAITKVFNLAIESEGGTANRNNSIFVSGSARTASIYGEVYVLFPMGDFNYTWHELIDDWYNTYDSVSARNSIDWEGILQLLGDQEPLKNAYKILDAYSDHYRKADEGGYVDGKKFRYKDDTVSGVDAFREIAEGMVVDQQLRQGLGGVRELMISCPEGYYYIPEFYFFKYVAPYLEINGLRVEDKQVRT